MAAKRRSLSMEYKLKLLSVIDKTPKKERSDLARLFNLPKSTLTSIQNNRKVIEEYAKKLGGRLSSRKKWKTSPFMDLELVLLAWIKQCYASNTPINGCIVREQALAISRKLGVTKFTASNGWLDRFKNRFGVMYKAKKSSTPNDEDNFTTYKWVNEQLLPLIGDYDPQNIFNVDETGLFFNLFIDGSCFESEDYRDCDDREDRITVLMCTNADGSEKLPPLVVGKFNRPDAFENLKSLPCMYTKNKNAWITVTSFEEYLNYVDHEMVSAGRKILLFADHCAAHPPNTNLRNVKVLFFPSSCSKEVQPLSNGVTDAFKRNYRKNFEYNAEVMNNKNVPPESKVTIMEALQFIVMSWEEIKIETIRRCFYKVGFPMTQIDSTHSRVDENLGPLGSIDPRNTIPTCGIQTIEEFCDQMLLKDEESEGDVRIIPERLVVIVDEDEDYTEESESQVMQEEVKVSSLQCMVGSAPTFEEALDGFNKYKQYVTSFNIDDDMQNTLLLMELALYKLHSREIPGTNSSYKNEEC